MQVGYRLIEVATGAVVNSWGGTWGSCPFFPNPLILPNGGAHIHAGEPGVTYDGYRVEPWEYDDLPALKAELRRRVDADAETQRLRYIPPGNGMQMTYAEKFAQAHAVQGLGKEAADAIKPENGIAQFPTLAASVGLEAATLWDCANLVLAKYAKFSALSNGIERKRLQGKKDIAAAKDVASAQAIYEAIVWT